VIKFSKLRKSRRLQRQRRHARVRKSVHGTEDRPRLSVYRSLNNIEGQLIDDEEGRTLLGLSTLAAELRGVSGDEDAGRKVVQAHAAGKLLAERARDKGIERVVFDRGGFKYHGRVKAFAEGAREGGLEF
jgi:large subunit ribosomal protein L18